MNNSYVKYIGKNHLQFSFAIGPVVDADMTLQELWEAIREKIKLAILGLEGVAAVNAEGETIDRYATVSPGGLFFDSPTFVKKNGSVGHFWGAKTIPKTSLAVSKVVERYGHNILLGNVSPATCSTDEKRVTPSKEFVFLAERSLLFYDALGCSVYLLLGKEGFEAHRKVAKGKYISFRLWVQVASTRWYLVDVGVGVESNGNVSWAVRCHHVGTWTDERADAALRLCAALAGIQIRGGGTKVYGPNKPQTAIKGSTYPTQKTVEAITKKKKKNAVKTGKAPSSSSASASSAAARKKQQPPSKNDSWFNDEDEDENEDNYDESSDDEDPPELSRNAREHPNYADYIGNYVLREFGGTDFVGEIVSFTGFWNIHYEGNNDFEEDFEDLNFDEMVRGINDYTRFMDEA